MSFRVRILYTPIIIRVLLIRIPILKILIIPFIEQFPEPLYGNSSRLHEIFSQYVSKFFTCLIFLFHIGNCCMESRLTGKEYSPQRRRRNRKQLFDLFLYLMLIGYFGAVF